jgi:adenylate cyclase
MARERGTLHRGSRDPGNRLPEPVARRLASALGAGTEQALIVALGLVFGFGLVRLRPVMAAVIGLGGMALSATLFYLVFRNQLVWFPWLIVVVQIGMALAWSILFNSVQLYVQKRLYEQTLSVYLSPKLVKKFSGNPDLLKPGAEEHTLTIFFSDIADFTRISQRMDSDALAKLMNKYFQTAVAECIHKTDGSVVKYIGDAIFAFWNAPEAQADHALRACEAALRLRECASARSTDINSAPASAFIPGRRASGTSAASTASITRPWARA